jgi:hypothetical protein
MTTQEIVAAILNGEADDGEDAIFSALKQRAKIKAQILGAALSIGDKVRFNDRVSPKYLRGVTATVTAKPSGSRVGIEIDNPALGGRFGGEEIRAYVSTLEKVE